MKRVTSVAVHQILRQSALLLAKTPREVGGTRLSFVDQYHLFLEAGRERHAHSRFLANSAGVLGQLGARLRWDGVETIFGSSAPPLVLGLAVAPHSLGYVTPDTARFSGSVSLPGWMFHEGTALPEWTVLYAPRTTDAGQIRAVVVPTNDVMRRHVATDVLEPHSFDVPSALVIETSIRPRRGGETYSLPLSVYLAPEILGFTMACGQRLLDELDAGIEGSAELLGSFRSDRSDARRVLDHRRRELDTIHGDIVEVLHAIDQHSAGEATLRGERRTTKDMITQLRHQIVSTVVGELPELHDDRPVRSHAPARSLSALTAREWEILSQLTTRATLPEIAARLYISPNTLKTHLKSLYRKIGVASRREAADLAEHATAS